MEGVAEVKAEVRTAERRLVSQHLRLHPNSMAVVPPLASALPARLNLKGTLHLQALDFRWHQSPQALFLDQELVLRHLPHSALGLQLGRHILTR